MIPSGQPHPVNTPWIRPTACGQPDPPRKRTTPIAFASSAFDPRGWSVPPTPSAEELDVNPFDTTQVHEALPLATDQATLANGSPPIIHEAHEARLPGTVHPPRGRVEPIGIVKATFDPRGWVAPSILSSTSSSSSLASDGIEEDILSPTDSVLLDAPGSIFRSNEPIDYTSSIRNGTSLPKAELDPIIDPPVSPSSDTFAGWSPVNTAGTPSRTTTPPTPCTKWMAESFVLSAPPHSATKQVIGQSSNTIIGPLVEKTDGTETARHDLLKPERMAHRRSDSNDSDITIRPLTRVESTASRASSYSSSKMRESNAYVIDRTAPDDGDDEIVLREIPVSDLHPSIARLSRKYSPPVPKAIIESAIELGLRPAELGAKVDRTKAAAMISLGQALDQRNQNGEPSQINLNRLDDDLLAVYGKDQSTADRDPEDAAPFREGPASIEQAPRRFIPSAPRSSPRLKAKIFGNRSPSPDLDDDPFANWTASALGREKCFDIDNVSSKLHDALVRASFETPRYSTDDVAETLHSNQADRGTWVAREAAASGW